MTPAAAVLVGSLLAAPTAQAQQPQRRNWFGDPFFQLAGALAGCPVPLGPLLTQEEQRREAHWRIERGTGCWLAGRCADSNAFRGDPALAERVRAALAGRPELAGSSVWVTVQARWVFLQGCVTSAAQATALEQAVRGIEGVEAVVPALDVGIGSPPRYRTRDR